MDTVRDTFLIKSNINAVMHWCCPTVMSGLVDTSHFPSQLWCHGF